MPRIKVVTPIAAPAARCFGAARDIDLHMASVAHTGERAVAGRKSGLIGLGETVTWRARHLGVVQHFTSEITAFDPPRYFQDRMIKGAFASFVHDHHFEEIDGRTTMTDVIEFRFALGLPRSARRSPLSPRLSRTVDPPPRARASAGGGGGVGRVAR